MYKLRFFSTTKPPEGDALDLFPLPKKLRVKDGKINRMTTVVLFKGSTIQPEAQLAIATVVRHHEDPDIPVLGQKFAIEKLIKKGSFDRTERREIWNAFWNYSAKANALRKGSHKEDIQRIKYSPVFNFSIFKD